jgi:hypothetical protein
VQDALRIIERDATPGTSHAIDYQLDRVRPAVFIIHATSPGNHQAWIAVTGVPEGKEQFKEFMRRVRKAVGGNDKSASHATRVAGTENFKPKYAPEFPTVTIVETHPGRVMTPEQLGALGLLAPPEPVTAPPLKFTRQERNRSGREKQWPSYEMSLSGAPQGQDGPDRSRADFWWSYLALQRGWSHEDTEAKLLEVSEKARERVRAGDSRLCARDGDERRRMAGAQPAAEQGIIAYPVPD